MTPFRPDAVLFDLDGTLLDSAPDFYRILNQLRHEQQLASLDYAQVRQQVSNGAAAMIQQAFGGLRNSSELDRLREQLLQHYQANPAQDSILFDGMTALLQTLEQAQIPWGIVTNKPERFCTPILQQLSLNDRCGVLICPDHVSCRKPDPEGLYKACSKLNSRPERSLYVGDHVRDIEAGRNAGMATAGALYGYLDETDQPEHWNADLLIEHPVELINWLRL
ncbi:HAD-IIIA family hydrolase [Motiliproteus coralliicola]|uniref:HAD-IIIA family hydrolase n=1 Tax=Motiliproteus coralliicola TaxID=2283196 RepID=A0A369WMT9_9GAMM|nr:HAD-IA family hydrolase [Motiliproteus coralliicola]RDE22997.1 HAD-IIIA family hydrolase [Motiliproteus coralliicola]